MISSIKETLDSKRDKPSASLSLVGVIRATLLFIRNNLWTILVPMAIWEISLPFRWLRFVLHNMLRLKDDPETLRLLFAENITNARELDWWQWIVAPIPSMADGFAIMGLGLPFLLAAFLLIEHDRVEKWLLLRPPFSKQEIFFKRVLICAGGSGLVAGVMLALSSLGIPLWNDSLWRQGLLYVQSFLGFAAFSVIEAGWTCGWIWFLQHRMSHIPLDRGELKFLLVHKCFVLSIWFFCLGLLPPMDRLAGFYPFPRLLMLFLFPFPVYFICRHLTVGHSIKAMAIDFINPNGLLIGSLLISLTVLTGLAWMEPYLYPFVLNTPTWWKYFLVMDIYGSLSVIGSLFLIIMLVQVSSREEESATSDSSESTMKVSFFPS